MSAAERSGAREQGGPSQQVSGASERANGRVSGSVLQSVFLAVFDRSAGLSFPLLLPERAARVAAAAVRTAPSNSGEDEASAAATTPGASSATTTTPVKSESPVDKASESTPAGATSSQSK